MLVCYERLKTAATIPNCRNTILSTRLFCNNSFVCSNSGHSYVLCLPSSQSRFIHLFSLCTNVYCIPFEITHFAVFAEPGTRRTGQQHRQTARQETFTLTFSYEAFGGFLIALLFVRLLAPVPVQFVFVLTVCMFDLMCLIYILYIQLLAKLVA